MSVVTLHTVCIWKWHKGNKFQDSTVLPLGRSPYEVRDTLSAQAVRLSRWLFQVRFHSILPHRSLTETYTVVIVSEMVRPELLVKVLCVLEACCKCLMHDILSLVTRFAQICDCFLADEPGMMGRLNSACLNSICIIQSAYYICLLFKQIFVKFIIQKGKKIHVHRYSSYIF